MMLYVDVFKRPLSVGDVQMAATVISQSKRPSMYTLQRKMGMGAGKAIVMIRLLEDAGVITEVLKTQNRSVILKNESAAINAALRQLRKGNG